MIITFGFKSRDWIWTIISQIQNDINPGATVFTNMWRAIGDQHEDGGKVVMVPHIRFSRLLTIVI